MKKYQISHSAQNWSSPRERPEESMDLTICSPEMPGSEAICHMRLKVNDNYQQLSWSRNREGVWVSLAGKTFVFREAASGAAGNLEGSLQSPMPAKVVEVLVKAGDHVEKDQALIRLEAMKMEFVVKAPEAGVVKSLKAVAGEQVEAGLTLVAFE